MLHHLRCTLLGRLPAVEAAEASNSLPKAPGLLVQCLHAAWVEDLAAQQLVEMGVVEMGVAVFFG